MVRPAASRPGFPLAGGWQRVKARASGGAGLDPLPQRAREGGGVRSSTDATHHRCPLVQQRCCTAPAAAGASAAVALECLRARAAGSPNPGTPFLAPVATAGGAALPMDSAQIRKALQAMAGEHPGRPSLHPGAAAGEQTRRADQWGTGQGAARCAHQQQGVVCPRSQQS